MTNFFNNRYNFLFLVHYFFNEIYNLNSKLEYIIIYLNDIIIT